MIRAVWKVWAKNLHAPAYSHALCFYGNGRTAHMCFRYKLLTVCVKVTVETKHHVNSNVVLKRQCEMVDTTFSVWKLSVCNSGRQIACKSTFMMVLYFV